MMGEDGRGWERMGEEDGWLARPVLSGSGHGSWVMGHVSDGGLGWEREREREWEWMGGAGKGREGKGREGEGREGEVKDCVWVGWGQGSLAWGWRAGGRWVRVRVGAGMVGMDGDGWSGWWGWWGSVVCVGWVGVDGMGWVGGAYGWGRMGVVCVVFGF